MSNRTERREAERQARKLAYQTQRQQSAPPPAAAPPPATKPQISEAQLAANRANSKLSSGPVTTAGRTKASMNSLKHGLTGKTFLLPSEDAAQYQSDLDEQIATYQPASEEELRLVQSLNDCVWRIDRIQRFEIGLLLKGDIEFAGKYEDRAPKERTLLIQAESYIKYEKQFRNLNIQEARLRRVREKDCQELLRLQAARKREEANAPVQTANGFDFATPPNPASEVSQPPESAAPPAADEAQPGAQTHTDPATFPAPESHQSAAR